jgi:hypothetical protein
MARTRPGAGPTHPPLAGETGPADRRQTGVIDAAAELDRLSRYCVYACQRVDACVEDECLAWRLQQTAAEHLVRHWVAAEG